MAKFITKEVTVDVSSPHNEDIYNVSISVPTLAGAGTYDVNLSRAAFLVLFRPFDETARAMEAEAIKGELAFYESEQTAPPDLVTGNELKEGPNAAYGSPEWMEAIKDIEGG